MTQSLSKDPLPSPFALRVRISTNVVLRGHKHSVYSTSSHRAYGLARKTVIEQIITLEELIEIVEIDGDTQMLWESMMRVWLVWALEKVFPQQTMFKLRTKGVNRVWMGVCRGVGGRRVSFFKSSQWSWKTGMWWVVLPLHWLCSALWEHWRAVGLCVDSCSLSLLSLILNTGLQRRTEQKWTRWHRGQEQDRELFSLACLLMSCQCLINRKHVAVLVIISSLRYNFSF